MKFALFLGCKVPLSLEHYALASRSVLEALGVELVELEFNCCGYPVRNLSFESFLYSAARNLALAGAEDLEILTPCKCCFGTLKHAAHFLGADESLKKQINRGLQEEGLHWDGRNGVKHLLSVLDQDVGLPALAAQIKHKYAGLKVAVQYGCHALRPARVTGFDNPLAPSVFDRLVAVTGAESAAWPQSLDCCGGPLWGKNNALSLKLLREKIKSAREAGAHYLCAACNYSQIQFDQVQAAELVPEGSSDGLGSILYPQLLGLSLGLPPAALGLERHQVDVRGVLNFLA